MADEQDRPDEPRKATPPTPEPSASGSTPPAKHAPAKAAKKAAKKAVKKAPAKAAKAAKGTKASAKKAAKKAPPPPGEAAPPPPPAPEPPVATPDPLHASGSSAATIADTNGETPFGAADETAAHARQAVDTAGDSLAGGITRIPGTGARVPIAVALVMALLAILLIRRLLSDD